MAEKPKTDVADVGSKAKTSTKGKLPAKRSSDTSVPEPNRPKPDVVRPQKLSKEDENRHDLNNNLMLECLKSIQASQAALVQRMDNFETNYAYCEDYDDYDYTDEGLSSPKRAKIDACSDSQAQSVELTEDSNQRSLSRFSGLSKKFKVIEVTDKWVDEVLADTVNDLFRKGMDNEMYDNLIKGDLFARPENCDGLAPAKMNKLVWDVMSAQSRTTDKKMQLISTSIVKAGICLTKTMDKAAKLERTLTQAGKEGEIDVAGIIEGCNDALAFLGHSNYQINMTRRDLLRPELKREYSHLCTHSIPVTKELFGDDVSKTAKEIEDCAKISSKMSGQYVRGGSRGRPWFRGRFRTNMTRGRTYGSQLATPSTSYRPYESKNFQRRGGYVNTQPKH